MVYWGQKGGKKGTRGATGEDDKGRGQEEAQQADS